MVPLGQSARPSSAEQVRPCHLGDDQRACGQKTRPYLPDFRGAGRWTAAKLTRSATSAPGGAEREGHADHEHVAEERLPGGVPQPGEVQRRW